MIVICLTFKKTCATKQNITVDKLIGSNTGIKCKLPLFGQTCLEALLDIEYIKAVGGGIPLTNIYVKDFSLLNWAMEIDALDDKDLPMVHSLSYGNDERQQTSAAFMDSVNAQFMKLGARGVSLLAASGDQGVWGRSGVYGSGRFNPDFPAGSPYITAVGGTDFVYRFALPSTSASVFAHMLAPVRLALLAFVASATAFHATLPRVDAHEASSALRGMRSEHSTFVLSEHTQVSMRKFQSTRFVQPGHVVPCLSVANIEVSSQHRRQGHARRALRTLRQAASDNQSILIVENVVSVYMHALVHELDARALPGCRPGARGCNYWLPLQPEENVEDYGVLKA